MLGLRILSKRFFAFSTISDSLAKQLTKEITIARTPRHIESLLDQHRGSFNSYNITALLKKTSKNSQWEDKLIDKIYREVKVHLDALGAPNRTNARAIANIIGYTGNLGYTGANEYFLKISYAKLLPLLNPIEMVLTLTGLIKLNIIDSCLANNIESTVIQFVNFDFQMGQLISIWRNLIKADKTTPGIDRHLGTLITLKPMSKNLKDYGYLVYCYLESKLSVNEPQISDKILKLLQKQPENILYSTRVNIFELCIIMDELAKLGVRNEDTHLLTLLLRHYERNIGASINLRSLANGFHSFIKIFPNPPKDIYDKTGLKFIKLMRQASQNDDYESVVSLFTQMIKISYEPTDHTTAYNPFSLSTFDCTMLIEPVIQIFFGEQAEVKKMTDKQFQKLLFALQLFIKREKSFQLEDKHCALIRQEIVSRNLSDLQLASILSFVPVLQLQDINLCRFFATKLSAMDSEIVKSYKYQDRLQSDCMLGLRPENCLNCKQ